MTSIPSYVQPMIRQLRDSIHSSLSGIVKDSFLTKEALQKNLKDHLGSLVNDIKVTHVNGSEYSIILVPSKPLDSIVVNIGDLEIPEFVCGSVYKEGWLGQWLMKDKNDK